MLVKGSSSEATPMILRLVVSYQREGERYVVLHLDWTVEVSRPIRWYGVVGLGNTKLGWEVNFPAIPHIS